MEQELRPCPFCGCAAAVEQFYKEGSSSRWHRAVCLGCESRGPDTEGCSISFMGRARVEEVAGEAVSAWNTRHGNEGE